jgi:tRNA-specific 2-thiouridylase
MIQQKYAKIVNMKVAALVSGGVDSSVALALLKQQGHDVTAFYLKIWLEDELSFLGDCPWEQDLAYVRSVCEQLGVPLEVVSLQKEYHERVVSYVVQEVKAGRTPNPDILCNQHIKFGMFLDKIDASFEKIASGHYAQVFEKNGIYELHQAPDAIKDQTYFLSQLSQQQLARALFPIGHLCKEQVRVLAEQYDLPNKHRKDSQGICFLGKLKFRDFIKEYLGEQDGKMIEWETKAVLGTHKGFWFYTIGQRQGLGLAGGPWYVIAKDADTNEVYISRNYYSTDKKRDELTLSACNWLTGFAPEKTALRVKLRHGATFNECVVSFDNSRDGSSRANLALKDRDQGIAPGQFAVLYDGDQCLGGGIIT